MVRVVICLLCASIQIALDDRGSSPLADSVTTANVIRSGHLPAPQLGVISEIERAIKALARTQAVKERICEYIQHEVSHHSPNYGTAISSLLKLAPDGMNNVAVVTFRQSTRLHSFCICSPQYIFVVNRIQWLISSFV